MSDDITTEEFERFNRERLRLVDEFRKRGRGSQQGAAYDIRVSPSRVSTVLHGRSIDWGVLNKLRAWVEQNRAA